METLSWKELQRLDEKEGVSSGVVLPSGGAEENNVARRRQAVHHALESHVELAKAKSELVEAGLGQEQIATAVEIPSSTTSPSESDISDLMRRMRDIADHEEF
jgi:hypothetical protein